MLDQKIIELLRTGRNDRALNALYKYFSMIRKMIRNYGGNTEDAEDIFQEALIILCRKASGPDFVLTAKLSTWLYSVCRFLWKDESKKRDRTIPFPEDSLPGSLAIQNTLTEADREILNTGIEEAIDEEGHIRLAEKVLLELGERCRQILVLFYKNGLKMSEIAPKMGYNSENSAKNQKYKCLESARDHLRTLQQNIQTL